MGVPLDALAFSRAKCLCFANAWSRIVSTESLVGYCRRDFLTLTR